MRYWFDTEFLEAGPEEPIHLLSIGIVAEDGREFYGVNADCPTHLANAWVKEHVLPHIAGELAEPRSQLRTRLLEFVTAGGGKPEFWAYYADYDWVVLCQLFGTMADLPRGWPMYCRDLKQLADSLDNPRLPEQGKGEHHALADARWNRRVWAFLQGEMERNAEP